MVELPGCRLELFSWKDIKRVNLFVCQNLKSQKDKQTNRWTDGQTDKCTIIHTDNQMNPFNILPTK